MNNATSNIQSFKQIRIIKFLLNKFSCDAKNEIHKFTEIETVDGFCDFNFNISTNQIDLNFFNDNKIQKNWKYHLTSNHL